MKHLLLSILALFMFTSAQTQKEGQALIDSLLADLPAMKDDTNKVKTLALLSRELKNYNTDEGIKYGLEGLKLSKKLNYPFGKGLSRLSLAFNYFHANRIPETIEHGQEAEQIFFILDDSDRLCATYLVVGCAYGRVDPKKEHDYYLNAKSIIYKTSILEWKLNNLSWLENISRQYDPDSRDYFMSLFRESQRFSPKKYYEAHHYRMMAQYFEDKGQLDSAVFYYRLTIPIFKEIKSKRNLGYMYGRLGRVMYWREEKPGIPGVVSKKDAEIYQNEAIRLGKETGIVDLVADNYGSLYRLQKSQNRIGEAFYSLEQMILFKDSVQTGINAREVTNQIWGIEMKLKAKEVELLELKNQQQLIGLISGVILVSILLVLIILIIRNRRKIQKAYLLVNQQKEQLDRLNMQLKESNTKLESTNQELLATNQELDAFSYSVSHDLRGPVRRIEGLCEALQEDVKEKLDESDLELLKHIGDSTVLMNGLIEDMLKLSRVTRKSVEKSSCNLGEMAAKINEELRHSYPERNVLTEVQENIIVEADPKLMQIALQNLLDNAWKYSSKVEHPKVIFGMKEEEGRQVLFVSDNGAGFDMTQAEKLFAPFQRLHSDDEFKGTGIGLATVKRIIGKHGGTIWAESEPGKGTTFYFTIDPQ